MVAHDVFIAKRKGVRAHVLLRAHRNRDLEAPDYAFVPEAADRLLTARDPESFLCAVEGFLPLVLGPLCKKEASSQKRVMKVGDFRSSADRLFCCASRTLLMEELTGIKGDCSEVNGRSLKRSVDGRDAMRDSHMLRYLEASGFSDEDVVSVEPLQDWTVAKAILENLALSKACMASNADGLNFERTTTHNGLWVYGKAFDRLMDERVKQFSYNSFWRSETAGEFLAEAVKRDSVPSACPLLSRYTDREVHPFSVGSDETHLRGSELILIKTSARVSGEAIPLSAKARKEVADRSIYLTADASCDDVALSADYVKAIVGTTKDLVAEDGSALGWEHDDVEAALGRPEAAVVFHSQWARLVYDIAVREEFATPSSCRHCGSPMLNHAGNRQRKFCSQSCKTQHCSKRRSEIAD